MRRSHVMLAAAATVLAAKPALAGNLGHFQPAVANLRDVLVPSEPGFYYAQYNGYYRPQNFRDRHGDKVDSITVRGRTIDVDADIDIYTIAPVFLYITDLKVLGARYGGYVIPTFGQSSVAAAVNTQSDFGFNVDNDGDWGIGDTFVQPLWLGWSLGSFELAAGYGFYAPTGRHDTGGDDNIGLGFWTHQFQLAGAWYLDQQHGTALVGALTYEINQNEQGQDSRPGDRLSLNYGVSQYLPLGQSFLAELGVAGYSQWQVTDDSGSDATNQDVHDQVHAIGLQAGVAYLPWKAQVNFRWEHEYYGEGRLIGDWFLLNLAKSF